MSKETIITIVVAAAFTLATLINALPGNHPYPSCDSRCLAGMRETQSYQWSQPSPPPGPWQMGVPPNSHP